MHPCGTAATKLIYRHNKMRWALSQKLFGGFVFLTTQICCKYKKTHEFCRGTLACFAHVVCQFRRKLILSGQVVCFLSNVSIFISRFPTCCLKFRSAALACLPIRHALFSTALVCSTGPATGIDGLTPKQCSLVQQSQCNGKWHQTCTCIHFNHVVHKSSRLWAATALVTGGNNSVSSTTLRYLCENNAGNTKARAESRKHIPNLAHATQKLSEFRG